MAGWPGPQPQDYAISFLIQDYSPGESGCGPCTLPAQTCGSRAPISPLPEQSEPQDSIGVPMLAAGLPVLGGGHPWKEEGGEVLTIPKALWEKKAHLPKLCEHHLTGALARSLSWKRQREPGQEPLGRLELQGFAKQLPHCGRKLHGSQPWVRGDGKCLLAL